MRNRLRRGLIMMIMIMQVFQTQSQMRPLMM